MITVIAKSGCRTLRSVIKKKGVDIKNKDENKKKRRKKKNKNDNDWNNNHV
jgi:hypothetical protein